MNLVSELVQGAVKHGRQRFEDAPLITGVKLAFYVGMTALALTCTWMLKSAGHIILSYPSMERKVEALDSLNIKPRLDYMEKCAAEMQMLHPRTK